MPKPREVAEQVLGGNDYLKEVLGLIPDDKKDTILSALGERVMAKDEFSRKMDDLTEKEKANLAYKSSLDGWYNEKLELLQKGTSALTELEKLQKNPPAGGSDTLKSLEGYVKKEDVEKLVSQRLAQSEEISLALLQQTNTLASKHLHLYGEPLDMHAVVSHARSKGLSVADAYDQLTADKAKELADKRAKADREKLRNEIKMELIKEQGHGVYPVGPQEEASPILTALGFKPKAGESAPSYGVQAAVDEYYRTQKPSST